MDEKFRQMLLEAEKVRKEQRGTGYPGTHGANMVAMLKYGSSKGLVKGGTSDILAGKCTEEDLTLAAEGAAMIIQMNLGEHIDSVVSLPDEEKSKLVIRANELLVGKYNPSSQEKSHEQDEGAR